MTRKTQRSDPDSGRNATSTHTESVVSTCRFRVLGKARFFFKLKKKFVFKAKVLALSDKRQIFFFKLLTELKILVVIFAYNIATTLNLFFFYRIVP